MTYQDFKILCEVTPSILTQSTSTLAKRFKVSEETVLYWRKQVRDSIRDNQKTNKVNTTITVTQSYESTPTIEDLEKVNYKTTSTSTTPVKTEIKPDSKSGFSVSSFKMRGNEIGEVWYKKEELATFESEIDWSLVVPKPFQLSTYKEKERKCLQVIFPTDSHISRRELSGRTIDEKCQEVIDKTIEAVTLAQKLYSIDTIVFITGSDMFNSDGTKEETVRGTSQQNNVNYDKAFEKAIDMNVTIIDYLYQNCKNLKVFSIIGNHAQSTEYMLGKYLQAYYRNFEIQFNVDNKFRKYFEFGNNGIMMHHGDVSKFDSLVAAFSDENPYGFCKKHITCLTGDKHFYKVTQLNRVTIRQFPALCLADSWSDSQSYNSTGFISEIFDEDKGHLLTIDLKS